MLKNVRLRTKLLSAFLLIGFSSIFITSWQSYRSAKAALEKASFDRLTAIRETKKRQIETYFDQIRSQAITFSENQMVIDAMKQFKAAFRDIQKDTGVTKSQISEYEAKLKDYYKNEYCARLSLKEERKTDIGQYWPDNDNAILLQYYYIASNPNPVGAKDGLEKASDGSEYSRVHAKYHPIIRDYSRKFHFYDIFLVDDETGDIVYTVSKEVDFGTSVLTGPYKNSNFARAFNDARKAAHGDSLTLVDFERYDPSYAAPASFVATPIFDGKEKVGILLFEISSDEINRIMTGDRNWAKDGLGKSGETYVVGADGKMRSDSRFIAEGPEKYFELLAQLGTDKKVIDLIRSYSTSILFQEVRTEATDEALQGKTDTRIIDDYRGVPVLSSFTPLNIEGVHWAILSEIDETEAFSSVYALRNRILLITPFITALIIGLGFIMSKTISDPIRLLTRSTKELGNGNLSRRVSIAGKDEIGLLAASFNQMAEDLQQTTVSKEYVDNIFASMTDALIVISPVRADAETGLPRAVVKKVNQSACKLLGYSEEELVGQPIDKIIAEDELFKGSWVDKLLKEGFISGVEKTCLAKDGRKIPVLFSGSAMRERDANAPDIVCVARDITERKRLEREILEISAREQRRIGQDLHDRLGQHLTGIAFLSKVLEKKLAAKSIAESAEAAKVANLVNEAISQTRDLARGLHPVELEEEGLVSELQRLASDVEDLFKISCVFECDTPVPLRDPTVTTQLYHIAQEAVSNAVKHGKAKHILIKVSLADGRIVLTVKDDGVGLPEVLDKSKGMGLQIMNYRATIIGASFDIKRDEGGGTIIVCSVENKKE